MNRESLTFKIDDLDWTFELTFDGDEEDVFSNKYRMKLNGCLVQKL